MPKLIWALSNSRNQKLRIYFQHLLEIGDELCKNITKPEQKEQVHYTSGHLRQSTVADPSALLPHLHITTDTAQGVPYDHLCHRKNIHLHGVLTLPGSGWLLQYSCT